MTIAGELINILGFKIEGEDKLRRYNRQLDNTEDMSKRTRDQVRRIGVAAGVAATGMIALGTQGVKNFAAFEREMNRIGITAGATVDATNQAAQSALRMADQMAMPIDQVVAGLDTLVSSGMNLEQAMAFLPAVLASAQASGAATEDIANTAIKASSALKIEAADMQRAFDLMVTGGKAGQFELADMAREIPGLANAFANLGYTGEEGLKRLIAVLQTVREDSGSAGAAATQVGEIFGKMLSPEIVKNFAELGTDIKAEMESAKAAGEDMLEAYVRISQETMKNNPRATLVDLFSDKELRAGMLSMMTSTDRLAEFMRVLNSSEVDGAVFRDLNRILSDTESQLQRLSTSWDTFMKTIGEAAADPVSSVLDAATEGVSKANAINAQLEKEGMSFMERRMWWMRNGFDIEEQDAIARRGGYARTETEQRDQREVPFAYEHLGRRPARPITDHRAQEKQREADRAAETDRERFVAPPVIDIDAYDARLRAGAVAPIIEPSQPIIVPQITPAEEPSWWRSLFDVFSMEARADESGARVPFETPLADNATIALDAFTAAVQRSQSALDSAVIGDTSSAFGTVEPARTIGGVSDVRPMPSDAFASKMQELAGQVSTINSNLAQMTGTAPVNATITDARQDNRAFPMSVNTTVNQTVTQATQAPGAAAQATGAAVSGAATNQAARIQQEPAF